MADINLLQDTTGDEGGKKQNKETPKIRYTDPSVEPKQKDSEPKIKRSGLFGGLFRKKPKEPNHEKPSASAKPEEAVQAGPVEVQEVPTARKEEAAEEMRAPRSLKGKKINESRFLEEKVQKKSEKKKKEKGKKPVVPDETDEIAPFMGVNLMPGDLIESLEPKRKMLIYGLVVAVSVALVTGLYFSLNYYENNIYEDVEDISMQIQDVESGIRGLREKQRDALLLKSQTDQVKDMLDNQIHWSNFFKLLEKYTLQEVVYDSFTGSLTRGTNPTFALSAQGLNYRSISRQLMVFREANDFVSNVVINSGQLGVTEGGTETFVTFPIQLTVLENIFYNHQEGTVTGEGE